MQWKIIYYSENLENTIFHLLDTLLAKFIKITELMKEAGPNIGMPHTKAMGDGLFELRLKCKEGIARVFYCTLVNKSIYLLHSIIKKQQKTPLKDLQIALVRMKEVKQCQEKHMKN